MAYHARVNKHFSKVFSVLTDKLRSDQKLIVYSGAFIAGGSLVSLAEPEGSPSDYDVFFKTEEALRLVLGSVHAWPQYQNNLIFNEDRLNPQLTTCSSGLPLTSLDDKNKALKTAKHNLMSNKSLEALGQVSYYSPNAVTLASRIQLVTRFIGEPEDVFSTFDYEHCKVYWEPSVLGPNEGTVTYLGESAEAIAKRSLIYNAKSRFVLSAFKRVEKFVKRGWSVPLATILNLKESLDSLDLSDPATLQEELSTYYGMDFTAAQLVREYCESGGVIDKEKLLKVAKEF